MKKITHSFVDLTPVVSSTKIHRILDSFSNGKDLFLYPIRRFNELDVHYMTDGLKTMLQQNMADLIEYRIVVDLVDQSFYNNTRPFKIRELPLSLVAL